MVMLCKVTQFQRSENDSVGRTVSVLNDVAISFFRRFVI